MKAIKLNKDLLTKMSYYDRNKKSGLEKANPKFGQLFNTVINNYHTFDSNNKAVIYLHQDTITKLEILINRINKEYSIPDIISYVFTNFDLEQGNEKRKINFPTTEESESIQIQNSVFDKLEKIQNDNYFINYNELIYYSLEEIKNNKPKSMFFIEIDYEIYDLILSFIKLRNLTDYSINNILNNTLTPLLEQDNKNKISKIKY